jgi:hypothetical protein
MGRPLKNANHPLARLRAQLSTKSHQVTRAELAKWTLIPEPTLKDIELGKFQLSDEIALKIAAGTGVSPTSLLEGEDPLRSWEGGEPVNARTKKIKSEEAFLLGTRCLLEAACIVADKEGVGHMAAFSIESAIVRTLKELGLGDALAREIIDIYPTLRELEVRPQHYLWWTNKLEDEFEKIYYPEHGTT